MPQAEGRRFRLYRYVSPDEPVELTNVRAIDKKGLDRGVISADQLERPMEYSNGEIFTGTRPVVIPPIGLLMEERADGHRYTYRLRPLVYGTPEVDDIDTSPNYKQRTTLSKLEEYLHPDSFYMHYTGIPSRQGKKCLEIMRGALEFDTWGKITHRIALFDQATAIDFHKHLQRMRNPPENILRAYHQELSGLDTSTLDRLEGVVERSLGLRASGEYPDYPRPMMRETGLTRALTDLNGFWKRTRVNASRRVREHYELLTQIGMPERNDPVKMLLAGLNKVGDETHENVVATLGLLRSKTAIPMLACIAIQDPATDVVEATVNALGNIPDMRVIEPLGRKLDDERPVIRRAVAQSLEKLSCTPEMKYHADRLETVITAHMKKGEEDARIRRILERSLATITQLRKTE